MNKFPRRRMKSIRGFGALAAIIVLVLLACLAAAVVRLNWSSQSGYAQDVLSARALRAATAGAEWGLFQAFRGTWTACSGATQTLDLRAESGFRVTVTCNSQVFNEGQQADGENTQVQTVRVFTIDAVACNGSAATCPDNTAATRPTYVERQRLVQATNSDNP